MARQLWKRLATRLGSVRFARALFLIRLAWKPDLLSDNYFNFGGKH